MSVYLFGFWCQLLLQKWRLWFQGFLFQHWRQLPVILWRRCRTNFVITVRCPTLKPTFHPTFTGFSPRTSLSRIAIIAGTPIVQIVRTANRKACGPPLRVRLIYFRLHGLLPHGGGTFL